ncbi:Hypothetical predicted protein [Olea europaea subsp. europaea]|uniref:Uncharacterized protein n=1 Tax=Olea europaea subsp. europaea TaxID=158383 RepID=A0A8S0RQG7_OLEEU|nr:Hypothetical predicted protein [Olea europaea subsp. europaea]
MGQDMPVDYDHKFEHELRWLRAKYQIEALKLRDRWLEFLPRSSKHRSSLDHSNRNDEVGIVLYKTLELSDHGENTSLESCPSLFSSSFLPQKLQRTISLPVDAVEL